MTCLHIALSSSAPLCDTQSVSSNYVGSLVFLGPKVVSQQEPFLQTEGCCWQLGSPIQSSEVTGFPNSTAAEPSSLERISSSNRCLSSKFLWWILVSFHLSISILVPIKLFKRRESIYIQFIKFFTMFFQESKFTLLPPDPCEASKSHWCNWALAPHGLHLVIEDDLYVQPPVAKQLRGCGAFKDPKDLGQKPVNQGQAKNELMPKGSGFFLLEENVVFHTLPASVFSEYRTVGCRPSRWFPAFNNFPVVIVGTKD